jgi:hypothetical protein
MEVGTETEMKTYRGWIAASADQRTELEGLGIEVEKWCGDSETYDVKLDAAAMDRLEPLWGLFYWGLYETP